MEFKFSINKSRSGSTHVLRDGISNRVWSDVLDFLQFRNGDFGSTRKYIDTYSRNGLVYMVVNKVASNTAALPREYQDLKGEPITNSEIEKVMSKPNSYQSEIEFRQTIDEYILLSGNTFIVFIEGVGMGQEMEVLDSANVKIIIDNSGDIVRYDYINNMGMQVSYEKENVLHIKLSNNLKIDKELKYWGLSPLKPMWQVIEASNDLFTARGAIWKNKGYAGILTNKSDTPLLKKEREELQREFSQEIGGAVNANGVKVSSGDLSYLQLGMSPGDLQLLEGNTDNLRMISSSYDMPSVLFNDMASSTYNNVVEAKRSAYTDAYIPLDKKINEKLSPWLSEKLGVEEVIVVDISRIEVLKLTTNEVANRLNEMSPQTQTRVLANMTQNEVRDLVSLNPVAGDVIGDVQTNNKPDEKETN